MKKIAIFLFLSFLNLIDVSAIESKIIYKIENEIITNTDIKNEFKYLLALNNSLKELNENQIFEISKQSIVKETIKRIELLKNFKTLDLEVDYTEMLIKNIYNGLDFDDLDSFILYLKEYDLNLSNIEKKIQIEALWNELIANKYLSKVDVDIEKLKNKIKQNSQSKSKRYLLSEIIFEVTNKNLINKKFNQIISSIEKVGFENTAAIYSISETSKNGGKIGWVNEKSLSDNIKDEIMILEKNEISQPIMLPTGILILKIDDMKEFFNEINQEEELKKAFVYERNKQLEQYSKIYYNKVKKNLEVNE
tara:strand:- start:2059 stop:2979 length:921 start_codon:yes stop_codon:yes gene_type:complete